MENRLRLGLSAEGRFTSVSDRAYDISRALTSRIQYAEADLKTATDKLAAAEQQNRSGELTHIHTYIHISTDFYSIPMPIN